MPDGAPSPETFFKAFGLLSHLYLTPVLEFFQDRPGGLRNAALFW